MGSLISNEVSRMAQHLSKGEGRKERRKEDKKERRKEGRKIRRKEVRIEGNKERCKGWGRSSFRIKNIYYCHTNASE